MTGKQIDIWQPHKTEFINALLHFANVLAPEFWWDELRQKMNAYIAAKNLYVHENWYGMATRKLKKLGYYQTGQYRRSPIKSRRGGLEAQWCKGDKTA
jgi:hypothetical protein